MPNGWWLPIRRLTREAEATEQEEGRAVAGACSANEKLRLEQRHWMGTTRQRGTAPKSEEALGRLEK